MYSGKTNISTIHKMKILRGIIVPGVCVSPSYDAETYLVNTVGKQYRLSNTLKGNRLKKLIWSDVTVKAELIQHEDIDEIKVYSFNLNNPDWEEPTGTDGDYFHLEESNFSYGRSYPV